MVGTLKPGITYASLPHPLAPGGCTCLGAQAMSCFPLGWPEGLRLCLASSWALCLRLSCSPLHWPKGLRPCLAPPWAGPRASGYVLLPLGLGPCLAPPWTSPRALRLCLAPPCSLSCSPRSLYVICVYDVIKFFFGHRWWGP